MAEHWLLCGELNLPNLLGYLLLLSCLADKLSMLGIVSGALLGGLTHTHARMRRDRNLLS